jgi:hypothetical protein
MQDMCGLVNYVDYQKMQNQNSHTIPELLARDTGSINTDE